MTDDQFVLHLKNRHPEMLEPYGSGVASIDKIRSRDLFMVAHNTFYHNDIGAEYGVEPKDNHKHTER